MREKHLRTIGISILIFLCIVLLSARYVYFVQRTIYEESVSHLTEIFHQSNSALNELANKNITYLHMASEYFEDSPNEEDVNNYINRVQKETKFTNFYFILRFWLRNREMQNVGYYDSPFCRSS